MNSLKQFVTSGCRVAAKSHVSVRGFRTAVVNRDIFKIQDEDDFKKRVLENKNLVILDFYAT